MRYGTLVGLQPAPDAPVGAPRALSDAWPLPALLAWAAAWAGFILLRGLGAPNAVALGTGLATAAVFAPFGATFWRRAFILLGFPLSLVAGGGTAGWPAWAWLLPLTLLALAYPLTAWRDAPFFPTPRGALDGLARLAPLPEGASVLDAGCGLGHGLAALRRAYPAAALAGIEWSRPLAALARWRAARVAAGVRRGDMWSEDWSRHAMVYLFQRPESLPRAVAKARAELAPGAWLASLEFEALELQPQAMHECHDGRPVWLYCTPFVDRATSGAPPPYSARRRRR